MLIDFIFPDFNVFILYFQVYFKAITSDTLIKLSDLLNVLDVALNEIKKVSAVNSSVLDEWETVLK